MGNSPSDERGAGAVTGAEVAPSRLSDRSLFPGRDGRTSVSRTGTAKGRVSGGVSTGFGENVAAVAEGMGPGAEAEVPEFGESPELPAGAHERAGVGRCRYAIDLGAGADAAVGSG
ncbi:hypothetical protein GCM10020221_13890 [Streptomyces thioluteus]|uniref:Uncharacterized protein n=1 Tax=Streptomyces thioluteus TaxID=66431 RepID=A0ABP6J2R8_STRTU